MKQSLPLHYLRIVNEGPLPNVLHLQPFKCVVVIEQEVSVDWRHEVSEWIAASGCLYMMAWGPDCGLWDDSVDFASIFQHDLKDIPADRLILTTWHENQTLEEVFAFSKESARHSVVPLKNTVLLHISEHDKESKLTHLYMTASS